MLFSDATDYRFENKVKVFNKYKTIVIYKRVKDIYKYINISILKHFGNYFD